jgi:CheY-like chemotaxis protein
LLKLEGLLNTGQSLRVDAMMQAGQHLLSLIEKVLSFSSIDAGRLEVRPEPLAVRPFMEGCMDVVAPIAVERKLPLSTVIAPDTPSLIVADPARLKQILLNLLGNALKYTDHGGVELRVSAGAAPGGLRIDVADTGRGIDPAVRARLFQSFERLDSADQVEGAGLGLAIAARITEAMHGSIGHAENPGGGSIFWLELPPGDPALPTTVPADRQADATSAQNSWGPGPPGNPPSGKRLLIVDDIEMNRDLLQAYLRAAKLVPVLAASGEEAVDLASKEAFDLILMDVRMPGMDGLEATRRIRAMPAPLGRVPILGVTAHAFAEQVADCLAAGMDGHIAKPLAYDALMEAISDIVARAPGLDLALA